MLFVLICFEEMGRKAFAVVSSTCSTLHFTFFAQHWEICLSIFFAGNVFRWQYCPCYIGDVEDETLQMRILTAFNLDKVATPPPSPLHFEFFEHF